MLVPWVTPVFLPFGIQTRIDAVAGGYKDKHQLSARMKKIARYYGDDLYQR